MAIKTPIAATINPTKSFLYNSSPSTIHAITAVVGGTRKNKFDVFEAEPILIRYIRIVKAPKDTIIICHPIEKINIQVHYFLCEEFNEDIILSEHEDLKWVLKKDLLNFRLAPGDSKIVKYL